MLGRKGVVECWRDGAVRRSSKLQAPSSRETPNTKIQSNFVLPCDFWHLGFGASLDPGSWSLELLSGFGVWDFHLRFSEAPSALSDGLEDVRERLGGRAELAPGDRLPAGSLWKSVSAKSNSNAKYRSVKTTLGSASGRRTSSGRISA